MSSSSGRESNRSLRKRILSEMIAGNRENEGEDFDALGSLIREAAVSYDGYGSRSHSSSSSFSSLSTTTDSSSLQAAPQAKHSHSRGRWNESDASAAAAASVTASSKALSSSTTTSRSQRMKEEWVKLLLLRPSVKDSAQVQEMDQWLTHVLELSRRYKLDATTDTKPAANRHSKAKCNAGQCCGATTQAPSLSQDTAPLESTRDLEQIKQQVLERYATKKKRQDQDSTNP